MDIPLSGSNHFSGLEGIDSESQREEMRGAESSGR